MRAKVGPALAILLLVLASASVAVGGDNKGEGPPANLSAPAPVLLQASSGQMTFRIDSHPELDFYQPCDGGDNMLRFPINISGVDPATAAKATLTMAVWDVDFDCGYWGDCERDTVYVNGQQLTTPMQFLTGANNQWSTVSFDIPPSFLKEGDNTITVYIDTLDGGWCVSCDWAEIVLDVGPEIEDLEVLGKLGPICFPLLYPVTVDKFYLKPKMKNMTGFEIVKVIYTGDISGQSAGGGEYGVTVPGGKHKQKTVKCVVVYKKTGTTKELKTKPFQKKFDVYFRRDKDDKKRIGSAFRPNWFTYWRTDGAVHNLGSFGYNNGGSFGSFDPVTHNLKVGPAASGYDAKVTVHGTRIGNTYGIDTAEVTCAHELKHKATHIANPGASLNCTPNGVDADGDGLTDTYENNTTNTLDNDPDTYDIHLVLGASYECYGDDEYLSRMAEVGARATAVEAKDWAHPGRKTTEKGHQYPAAVGPTVSIDMITAIPGLIGANTGSFTGDYSDAGTDTDGNGLFDSLSVSVGVSVDSQETYRLVGILTDAAGAEAGMLNVPVDLNVGSNTCVLEFDGVEIHRSGVNGPYRLSVTLIAGRDAVLDSETNVYTTGAYTISQFEGHQAYFGPNVVETPVCTDADGRYEKLEFAIDTICTVAGDYEVNAFLMDSDENEVCRLSETVSLAPGTSTVTLVASGPDIRRSRLNGPYKLLYLEILDGEKQTDFRYDACTTRSYSYTDFESGLAEMGAVSSFTDQGIDTNSNTLYDILRITIPTNVIEEGEYAISGDLCDSEGNTICDSYSELTLEAGAQNLAMDFSGRDIFTSGVNGPYGVRYTVLYDPDSSVADEIPGQYTTTAYSFTQFEAPGGIALTQQFDDRSLDTNSDGTYEYLDVDVGVVVVQTGTYALNARLADKDGGEIGWASTSSYLTAGTRCLLTLRYYGSSIYDHGVDGPFHVQDVYIYNTSAPTLSDTYAGPYVTKAAWAVSGNEPPVANAGPDQVVKAAGPTGTLVLLDGSQSTDPDSTSGTNDDIVLFEWLENSALLATGPNAGVMFPVGIHNVTLRVTDSKGATDEDTLTVEVYNNPPDKSKAYPSISRLWPPSSTTLKSIQIKGVTDPDGDPVKITITSIFQDEPTRGQCTGDISPDGFGVGASIAKVRAERSTKADGRVYTIGFKAEDNKGGISTGYVKVEVPRTISPKLVCVDGGPIYDSTKK